MGKTAYKDAPSAEDTGYAARALTDSEAAEMLEVSQVFLTRLVDDDVIPHHMVGKHRRIMLRDVLALKKEWERRNRILDEIVARDQAMGLYPKP